MIVCRGEGVSHMERAPLYMIRTSDGIVMLVDDKGRLIDGQVKNVVEFEACEIARVTTTIEPEGWFDVEPPNSMDYAGVA